MGMQRGWAWAGDGPGLGVQRGIGTVVGQDWGCRGAHRWYRDQERGAGGDWVGSGRGCRKDLGGACRRAREALTMDGKGASLCSSFPPLPLSPPHPSPL